MPDESVGFSRAARIQTVASLSLRGWCADGLAIGVASVDADRAFTRVLEVPEVGVVGPRLARYARAGAHEARADLNRVCIAGLHVAVGKVSQQGIVRYGNMQSRSWQDVQGVGRCLDSIVAQTMLLGENSHWREIGEWTRCRLVVPCGVGIGARSRVVAREEEGTCG